MCKEIKEFVFRFECYENDTQINSVDTTNVVEYQFINGGTSIVEINGTQVYPAFSGLKPDRLDLNINSCEEDMTVYKFKFKPLDMQVLEQGEPEGNITRPYVGPVVPVDGQINFNRLIVISKMFASIRKLKRP